MLILIESTDELVAADGIPCRVWAGETDQGEPVRALIYRLGVQDGEQTYLYDAELNLHVLPDTLPEEPVTGARKKTAAS